MSFVSISFVRSFLFFSFLFLSPVIVVGVFFLNKKNNEGITFKQALVMTSCFRVHPAILQPTLKLLKVGPAMERARSAVRTV